MTNLLTGRALVAFTKPLATWQNLEVLDEDLELAIAALK